MGEAGAVGDCWIIGGTRELSQIGESHFDVDFRDVDPSGLMQASNMDGLAVPQGCGLTSSFSVVSLRCAETTGRVKRRLLLIESSS